MKPISVRTQKTMSYLPGVNQFCMYIWIYNCFYFKKYTSITAKSLFIVFSSSAPLMFFQMMIELYWPLGGKVVKYAIAYLIPLLIGYRLAMYQEVLEKKIHQGVLKSTD